MTGTQKSWFNPKLATASSTENSIYPKPTSNRKAGCLVLLVEDHRITLGAFRDQSEMDKDKIDTRLPGQGSVDVGTYWLKVEYYIV
ncbi:hypothetical protein K0M31_007101 [Melipona bicolor]|uniref:Uncharacterized protein n=1 Tax=Melipona bicolor TaxID=60889 RepID=A0AA40KKS2_9HYME|nr:hypothetical protein K0M31_007101 [Melipona bicolor]